MYVVWLILQGPEHQVGAMKGGGLAVKVGDGREQMVALIIHRLDRVRLLPPHLDSELQV